MLKEGRPDTVILATGSYPVTVAITGIEAPHVFDAREVLTGQAQVKGPVVILGAGYVGMETADFLVDKGIETAIIEMLASPPVNKMTAHGYWLHKRIRDAGGKIYLGATLTSIDSDCVHFSKGGVDETMPAASVITALGAQADNALEAELKEAGIAYVMAGDSKGPRRILEAIHEGHRAGREI
jgi:pyruvate/2-oxoglutarate dehydrogenase complex dihydrolipoamide dehydrogenase (E3) component